MAILHGLRYEDEFTVAAITILFVWFKMLSYFRGFRGSGVFTRLVLKILFEIRYFLLVWFVVLLGFANAYIILFQGNNQGNFLPLTTGDLHFLNMGTAFISMFKGSTGGGLDLVWRGDSGFPNGASSPGNPFPVANSQLYNLQLILYVLFTLACNVLLLNMLIALMSSVYDEVNQVAAAQYRLDKTRLMLNLEKTFIGKKSGSSKRWLHVIAPKESEFWKNSNKSEIDEVKDHVDRRLDLKFEESNERIDTKFKDTDKRLLYFQDEMNAKHNNFDQRFDKLEELIRQFSSLPQNAPGAQIVKVKPFNTAGDKVQGSD